MLHHVNKLAQNPDKYDYLPVNVMRLVKKTTTYKLLHGLELDSAADDPSDMDLQEQEVVNLDIQGDEGVNVADDREGEGEEGEEEHPEEDPEEQEFPDFKDKNGCKHFREQPGMTDDDADCPKDTIHLPQGWRHLRSMSDVEVAETVEPADKSGFVSDDSVEIVSTKGLKVDKTPMPILTAERASMLKRKRDDSSDEARGAPVAPAKKGCQKHSKGQKLMEAKPKAKAGQVNVDKVDSSSSSAEPELHKPFYLGQRKPQQSRLGEWYILQAPGGPGRRYRVLVSWKLTEVNIFHGS